MRVEYRTVCNGKYDISCKVYLPDDRKIRRVILGAHGESPVSEEYFTVENCRNDLLFMAEYVRREFPQAQKLLFGTSFGGYIALLCAEELEDFRFGLPC